MEKLYSLVITDTQDKKNLYIKLTHGGADFLTYFNAFSIIKWKRYTTLKQLCLKITVSCDCKIVFYILDGAHRTTLREEDIKAGIYQQEFSVDNLSGDILGFELKGLDSISNFISGAYYGVFSQWKPVNIGVVVCTFKREQYVCKTMQKLKMFSVGHAWLFSTIVDNGSTLDEIDEKFMRVIHNPNYGGSGGFARGMIETVQQGVSDYVLLMDDDINIDLTAIERMRSLLCGLRTEYKDNYVAGAMLEMERPNLQFERSAYWSHIHLKSIGKHMDLSKTHNVQKNEVPIVRKNLYGGWWFCCMPVQQIKKLGYPLPMFIKGDDIEFGMRNDKEFITLNGIGVWHEVFAKKINPEINYFSDRNMLIVNNFAKDCGFSTYAIAVFCRLVKRLLLVDKRSLEMYYCAIKDYSHGFKGITAEPPFKTMKRLKTYKSDKNILVLFFCAIGEACKSIINYSSIHQGYIDFRKSKLQDAKFWMEYLKLK